VALVTCPECGKQVSDNAAACPQCGAPNRRFERANMRMMVLLAIATFLLVLVYTGVLHP
jgi:endogenous inhibitor of DNA gyrase (YacG/DUF329 family)